MRGLTIQAKSFESAQLLYSALSGFGPELQGDDEDGYCVNVALDGGERTILDVLNVLEQHVTALNEGPARFEVEGHRYTLHPKPAN
jgi:hypothetical protein